MPFDSGRVTFCRFHVEGDAPTIVDDVTLATLAENAFAENHGAPAEVESGFTTGEHIFDTNFTYEKNGFGPGSAWLLFALRIDTNKPPADIKQAYRRIQELALAEQKDNPTGFLSKKEKRDAKDLSDRQLHDDLASGKFRRSKAIPILWDLSRKEILFASTSAGAADQLHSKMRDAFNVSLETLTSGAMAGRILGDRGRTRDYEDLRPTALTSAPPEAYAAGDEFDRPRDAATPFVPWVQTSTDTKDFLGNEFLIWLWWKCETAEGLVGDTAIVIDKSLDLECAWGVRGKDGLRGDAPTKWPEAADALATGKWPRKAGLILADNRDGRQWEMSFQADRMIIGGANLPAIENAPTFREQVDARLESIRNLADQLDTMYKAFVEERTSSAWSAHKDQIRHWIRERQNVNV